MSAVQQGATACIRPRVAVQMRMAWLCVFPPTAYLAEEHDVWLHEPPVFLTQAKHFTNMDMYMYSPPCA